MTSPLIRLARGAIHLLPQAGEVKNISPLPFTGEDAEQSEAGEGRTL